MRLYKYLYRVFIINLTNRSLFTFVICIATNQLHLKIYIIVTPTSYTFLYKPYTYGAYQYMAYPYVYCTYTVHYLFHIPCIPYMHIPYTPMSRIPKFGQKNNQGIQPPWYVRKGKIVEFT